MKVPQMTEALAQEFEARFSAVCFRKLEKVFQSKEREESKL